MEIINNIIILIGSWERRRRPVTQTHEQSPESRAESMYGRGRSLFSSKPIFYECTMITSFALHVNVKEVRKFISQYHTHDTNEEFIPSQHIYTSQERKINRNLHQRKNHSCTELGNKACTWFGEICSCALNNSKNKFHTSRCKPYFRAMYCCENVIYFQFSFNVVQLN